MLWRGSARILKRPPSDSPGEILRVLSRAKKNAALYGVAHPFIVETFAALHELLARRLASRSVIKILIHEETFFIDDTILLEDSLQLQPLLIAFEDRGIEVVRIEAGVEPQELSHLVDLLNLDTKELQRLGGATRYFEDHMVTHITVGALASPAAVGGTQPGRKSGGRGPHSRRGRGR